MSKKIAVLVALAAGFLVAACGAVNQQPVSSGTSAQHGTKASPTATPAPGKNVVTVGSPVFGGAAPDPSVYFSGDVTSAVTLTNESKADAAESITMQWTAYNAAGAVIDTEPMNIGVLQPGQALTVTTDLSNAHLADVARVAVIALPNMWVKSTQPSGTITGQNISIAKEPYGTDGYNVAAELTSGWSQNLEGVPAWASCTDGSGKFVGAGRTMVNLIPASGSGVGSASFVVVASTTPANCTVDAQPALVPQGS